MAKISRITTQKKNKQRFNIFLDHGQGESYGFSVSEDLLVKEALHKGMELDMPTIEALIEKDDLHKSFSLAINYLSYRMRSEKEMRDYLEKKETDHEQVEVIIKRLYEEKLLDDQEFANSVVRSSIHTSSKGPLMIKKSLMEKGVSAQKAEQALEHFPFSQQYEKAMKFAQKKMQTDSKKSYRQQIQALQQTLMQKGYKNDVIQEVLANLPAEEKEQEEWQAVVYQGEKLLRKYERKAEGYELKQKIKAALYRKGFGMDDIQRFLDEYVEKE
ncbi:recombination regulator RecX [Thalassobacillus pellis]|uniref:recombination regulator RecX n=1 Tax=Thalassobacillus pellis TaxID=748008 RepID=UPI001960F146|nr:recombination regulator RecX [Thalassobacillus pellis]MBM7553833.1 regulatory protein [Thalassobacillus pellis]